jgi:hypothetical protein
MELQNKRLRFRDVDGREWDVDQLLNVPAHVAVQILTNIDNVLDLHNFANASNKARKFMKDNRVFERWDEKWFGPEPRIRTLVVNSVIDLSDNIAFTNKIPESELQLTDMFIQFALVASAQRGEFAFNQMTPEAVADMKRIFSAYREGSDSLRQPVARPAPFLYKVFSFCDRHGLYPTKVTENVRYETPEDILAFHICLKAVWDDMDTIEVLDLNREGKTSFRVRPTVFQKTVIRIQQLLLQGYRIRLPDGPSNVRFVNSCLVCGGAENIKSKCSKCSKPVHEHCWQLSGHENKC